MSKLIVNKNNQDDINSAVKILTVSGLDKSQIESILNTTISDTIIDEVKLSIQIYRKWNDITGRIERNETVIFNNRHYKCSQAHPKSHFTPPQVPALFDLVPPVGVLVEWTDYPVSSTFNWQEGDRVLDLGILYESKVNNNVWRPRDTVPNQWIII